MLLSIVLSSVLVSAFWSKSITGNVVDETPFEASGNCEQDTDGGVYAYIAGAVKYRPNSWSGSKAIGDRCVGSAKTMYDSEGKAFRTYSKIEERYCEDGKMKSIVFDSETLGEGYCIVEYVGGIYNSKGLEVSIKSAKWIPANPSCSVLNKNTVRDEKGNKYMNYCGNKENKNVFYSYSCSEDGTIKEEIQNCSLLGPQGRCSVSLGCFGEYTDTDPENNINIPGVLTIDGLNYSDRCSSKGKSVKQYTIVNGKAKVLMYNEDTSWTPCGTNRECVTNNESGAGYCRDKFAGVETIETIETLRERINSLSALIETLFQRIEALETTSEILLDDETLED